MFQLAYPLSSPASSLKQQDEHHHHERLSPEIAKKIVRYARKRIKKSGIHEALLDLKVNDTDQDTDQDTDPDRLLLDHSAVVLGDKLGAGSFSRVYELTGIKGQKNKQASTSTKSKYVVKVLQPKLLQNPALFAGCSSDLIKEGLILNALHHPNILKCRGWSSNQGTDAYASGKHDAFFLILDRLDSTLDDQFRIWRKLDAKLLKKKRKQNTLFWNMLFQPNKKERLQKQRQLQRLEQHSMEERSRCVLDLAEAIKYLHSRRILHRDLKPDNIGFTRAGVLQVLDFDVARVLPQEHLQNPQATFRLTKNIGSPRYMSPEVALAQEYNAKSDVYTFSLLCFELITLIKPYTGGTFPASNKQKHEQLVFHQGVRPEFPTTTTTTNNNFPESLTSLLTKGWSTALNTRPTMAEMRHALQQQVIPEWMECAAAAAAAAAAISTDEVSKFSKTKLNGRRRLRPAKSPCVQPETRTEMDIIELERSENTATSTRTSTTSIDHQQEAAAKSDNTCDLRWHGLYRIYSR